MTLRIAVLGNCQAPGLGQCLRRLSPGAVVTALSWGEIDSAEQAERTARDLLDHDIILSQFTKNPAFGALRTDRLADKARRFVVWPKIVFTGFHPDLIEFGAVRSPLGPRHSGIILAAFLHGLPRNRVADLFNAYVYGRLGFFDEHAKAEHHLLEAARRTDIPLDAELPRWRELGVFVHVPNHPIVAALASLADSICESLGLDRRPAPAPTDDSLAQFSVWPVYPEIARRLGVPGSLSFKPPGADRAPIGLDEMIAASYAAYERTERGLLDIPRATELAAVLATEGL